MTVKHHLTLDNSFDIDRRSDRSDHCPGDYLGVCNTNFVAAKIHLMFSTYAVMSPPCRNGDGLIRSNPEMIVCAGPMQVRPAGCQAGASRNVVNVSTSIRVVRNVFTSEPGTG